MSRSLRSINCENVRDGTGGWIFLWKSKPRVSFARQKGWVEQFLRWDFGLQTKIASDSSWGFPFFVAGSVTPLKIPAFLMHRFSATEHCRQLARCTTWEKAQRKPPKLRSFTDKLLTPYRRFSGHKKLWWGALFILWKKCNVTRVWTTAHVLVSRPSRINHLKVELGFESAVTFWTSGKQKRCRVSNSTSRPLSSEKVPPQQSFEVKNITTLHFH